MDIYKKNVMGKKVRLTESELIKLIKRVVSEQLDQPDTEILSALEDMGFAKKYCKNFNCVVWFWV